NRQKDHYSKERLESLTTALKAAGRRYEIVTHDGDDKAALDATMKYLHDHPKVSIILADHEVGMVAAYNAALQLSKSSHRTLIRGGYAACDGRTDETILRMTEAVANRNTDGYTLKVLDIALDQMDGKPAPGRVEVPIRFIRNPHRTPGGPIPYQAE
ncbi:MAG: hypothetical protein ACP5XB_21880, partial [Isosphaeraceae bacterium]